MQDSIVQRAAEIEAEFGLDIDEALSRWDAAGGRTGGYLSAPWLSVAFLFGRRLRDAWRLI